MYFVVTSRLFLVVLAWVPSEKKKKKVRYEYSTR